MVGRQGEAFVERTMVRMGTSELIWGRGNFLFALLLVCYDIH